MAATTAPATTASTMPLLLPEIQPFCSHCSLVLSAPTENFGKLVSGFEIVNLGSHCKGGEKGQWLVFSAPKTDQFSPSWRWGDSSKIESGSDVSSQTQVTCPPELSIWLIPRGVEWVLHFQNLPLPIPSCRAVNGVEGDAHFLKKCIEQECLGGSVG